MAWNPRKAKWPWRDFLTEEEVDEVRGYERKIATAKYEMAMAQPPLNLIRNRAIHRAKYAAANQSDRALAALKEQPDVR